MSYKLFVGDFAYSSWSLRGWLLFDAFGIDRKLRHAHMRSAEFNRMRDEMAPSWLVPAVEIAEAGPGGGPTIVWDTLAIAETLHERHQGAGIWPADPAERATLRSVAAEMHSGFGALRGACPMNIRRAWDGFVAAEAVTDDLARLETLWSHVKRRHGAGGPWLAGQDYSAADAFLTPVASRITTYGLKIGHGLAEYVQALCQHPAFRRWRAMAFADPHIQAHYELDYPARPDPWAPARTGRAVEGVDPENAACPFSGKPVSPDSLVEIEGRVIGFCNRFCRDKVAADPDAWPKVTGLLDR